jgi:hypothetical protein
MAFEFKIQLMGIGKPSVYRKLKVPDNFTFDGFHIAIQNTFGWQSSHLFSFSPGGFGSSPQIEIPYEESEDETIDPAKIKLKEIFKKEKQTFIYIYDFGDSWTHKITLEKITTEKIKVPSCIGGKGKCPPEDCGGISGYQDLLEILSNPLHSEYDDTRTWLGLEDGEDWDASEFDLKQADKMAGKMWLGF